MILLILFIFCFNSIQSNNIKPNTYQHVIHCFKKGCCIAYNALTLFNGSISTKDLIKSTNN